MVENIKQSDELIFSISYTDKFDLNQLGKRE